MYSKHIKQTALKDLVEQEKDCDSILSDIRKMVGLHQKRPLRALLKKQRLKRLQLVRRPKTKYQRQTIQKQRAWRGFYKV